MFLQSYIQRTGTDALRKSHQDLIAKLAYIAEASEIIQNSDATSAGEKDYAKSLVIELEDNLQTGAEQVAIPILKELRQKRSGFITDYETAMTFFYFISHQYFRTKGMREAIGRALAESIPGYDFARLKNIVSHIGALNVGCSLFVDRKEFDIVFLESGGELGFITGDQPVVNLMGTGDGRETKELALYYPLSPTLSCLVSPLAFDLRSRRIPDTAVEVLNKLVAWESRDFLVAGSKRDIEVIVNGLSRARPLGSRILDLLVEKE